MKHTFRSAFLGLMILFTSGFAEQFCWPEEYEHGCSSDQNIAFGDRAYVRRSNDLCGSDEDGWCCPPGVLKWEAGVVNHIAYDQGCVSS
ncbi:hypothetical protein PGT21_024596 [Puccinia graminis f. sp. tritici]|uniref:CBM1 domain-containing protein n=1 Tax=Puccinia graminis f. sp. tritici TaxID=56615 RepID=A0A5B0MPU9_PUCGR|nr:hypothetical protein PGT21_024596 [Puccinia graminis f. sp. tritici]